MDRALNPRDEKQTIYEIYRACRLCGAGAGYKMPIIQNVVDLDGDGVELRQKIKECVQIEVNHTDRMPPLICELCVDKVNDFYEFLDMCKENNKRTRLKLGLPLQTRAPDSVDSENCILGVTEPVFFDESESQKSKSKKTKIKKEPPEVKIKSEQRPSPKPDGSQASRGSSEEPRWANASRTRRQARSPSPSPSPKRTTRQNTEAPTILQVEDCVLMERRLKRLREKETKIDTPPPSKKSKIAPEPVKVPEPIKLPEPIKVPKPGPKSMKKPQNESKETPKSASKLQAAKPPSKKEQPPPPTPKTTPRTTPKTTPKSLPSKAAPVKVAPVKVAPVKVAPVKVAPVKVAPVKVATAPTSKALYCQICNIHVKTIQGLAQHNTKHYPVFTSPKHACNACELWFSTVEETSAHHRNHRNQNIPYKCTRCYGYFKLQQAYEDHFGNDLCLSVYEVPDVKCWECWRTFPTNKLMEEHKCAGEDGRPGGKCKKCSRNYALLKNLTKHESMCNYKKKGEVTIDPAVKASLLPMQVRIAKCDQLLKSKDHVDSSKVSHRYGLDSKCLYPYLSRGIKVKHEPSSKPFNPMVSINQDVKEEFCNSYVHWDSDNSDVSETASADSLDSCQKKVDSLSTISLKTIFSKRCMGRVRRKIRTMKATDTFDSFNADFDLSAKIDSILTNLGNEESQTSYSNDSDSILDRNHAVDENNKNIAKNQSENDSKDDDRNTSPTIIKCDQQNACSNDSDSILNKNNVKSDDLEKDESNVSEETSKRQNDTSETPEKCIDTPEKQETENIDKEAYNGSDEQENKKETEDVLKLTEENDAEARGECATEKVMNDDIKENDHMDHDDNEQTEIEKESVDRVFDDSMKIQTDSNLINEKDSKNGNLDSPYKLVENNIEILKTEDNILNCNIQIDDAKKMEVDEDDITKNDIAKDTNNHHNIDVISENNENFSKIDEITRQILKENETDDELNKHDVDDDKTSHSVANVCHQKSDPQSDSISITNVRTENGVENKDKFNVNDLSENDRLLMAELDAQIGDDDPKIGENNEIDQEQKIKHNLDLKRQQDKDLSSLDLDNISDEEFNFDV